MVCHAHLKTVSVMIAHIQIGKRKKHHNPFFLGVIMKMEGRLVAIVVFLAIAVTVSATLFAMGVGAGIQYSNAFGSDVTMAYDAASLQGIKDQVMIIWNNMNQTFDTGAFKRIYNSGMPWDQVKENSMAYQNVYFNQLIDQVNQKIEVWDNMKANGTTTYQMDDWLAKVINQTRIEMKREGGLDWVLNGAWYLQEAPVVAWSWLYALLFWLLFVAVLVLAVFWSS